MKVFGSRLKGTAPVAGPWLYVQLLLIVGLVIGLVGTGINGIDRLLIGFGAFACGVFMAPSLPIWRDMTEDENARMKALELVDHPWTPWVKMAKRFNWPVTVLVFLVICGALAVLATSSNH